MAYVHVILWIVLIYTSVSRGISQSTCRPPGADGIPYCCPFYFLKNNSCEECPAGYNKSPRGDNCSVPCRHPSYGARCGSQCNCFKKDCHHVYGCLVTTTVNTEMSFKTTFSSVTESTLTSVETLQNHENMRRLSIRRYVIGIGLVLVAIMVVINIFNIYTYWKRN